MIIIIWRIFKELCSVPMYKYATQYMELMLLLISKGFLKIELLLLYIAMQLSLLFLTIILSNCMARLGVFYNNFVNFFFGSGLGTVVGLTSSQLPEQPLFINLKIQSLANSYSLNKINGPSSISRGIPNNYVKINKSG